MAIGHPGITVQPKREFSKKEIVELLAACKEKFLEIDQMLYRAAPTLHAAPIEGIAGLFDCVMYARDDFLASLNLVAHHVDEVDSWEVENPTR
jgi:hypothetical protein